MKILFQTIFVFILVLNYAPLHSSAPQVNEEKENTTLGIGMNIGGEFFAKQALEKRPLLFGLAAIMIDLDLQVSNNISGFAAFHFDSGIWHSFLNRSFVENEEKSHTDIELHVEEFFVAWNPIHFVELKAGRRYSRISRANYMHLADFEFNAKPRVLTTFFGDNHGLAIDGISAEIRAGSETSSLNFLTEIGRNGIKSNNLLVANTIEAGFASPNNSFFIKGFSIFDNQQNDNSWFSNHFSDENHQLLNLTEGIKLNAVGASLNYFTSISNIMKLKISAEVFSRKIENQNLMGGFGFAQATLNKRFSLALAYQSVEIPTFENQSLATMREQSLTFGLSWFPDERQRLNLELSQFSNSPLYNNMILLKYTFNIGINSSSKLDCSSRCQRGRPGRGLGRRWLNN